MMRKRQKQTVKQRQKAVYSLFNKKSDGKPKVKGWKVIIMALF